MQQPTPAPSFRVPSLAANEQPKRLPQIGGDASASSSSTTGGGVLGGAGSRISRLLGAEQPKEVPVAEVHPKGDRRRLLYRRLHPEQATRSGYLTTRAVRRSKHDDQAESREATVTAVPSASVAPTAAMVEIRFHAGGRQQQCVASSGSDATTQQRNRYCLGYHNSRFRNSDRHFGKIQG